MDITLINQILNTKTIRVLSVSEHSKASEKSVEVTYTLSDGSIWEGLIPYFYRRTGLFLQTEQEVADYLLKIAPYFEKETARLWIAKELLFWKTEMSGKEVTKPFFEAMQSLEWTSNFPANDNPQRRIQDIKELGYTIASKNIGQKMQRLLLPIPRGANTGYEVFSATFKKRILKTLSEINVYELSSANKSGLLADHKFPEIRWDEHTKVSNNEDMAEDTICAKFQLLDNQRNQQKREVCRRCFQTDERGILFGIHFFYAGAHRWDEKIPRVGKDAEQGCIGCGWYDIAAWRNALQEKLDNL
jgi:hypothetical protein